MAKVLAGKVVGVKMNNTVVVEVVRRTPHPIYKKLVRKSKKFKVDSTGQAVTVGQDVKIVETRPISKDKHFKVLTHSTVSSDRIGSGSEKEATK